MADKPSGGDNKIHQIIMALITTIAAPVVVFYVTNSLKNSTPATPTPIVQVVTATSPAGAPAQPGDAPTVVAGTAIALPTSTVANNNANPTAAAEKPTEPKPGAGITSPSGTIPAGTPVQVGDLTLTVNKEDVKVEGKTVRLSVHVKNTGTEAQTLTFTPASISLKDDKGHSYSPIFGEKKEECKKDALNQPHSLEIKPGAQVNLTSVSADKAAQWCAGSAGSAIPLFNGPLEKGAKKLNVIINGVGPFKGFQVEIGL